MREDWRVEMVELLPKHLVMEFKAAFSIFDADGTGQIKTARLGELMVSLGQNLTATELDEMIHAADEDGSGTIEQDEFLVLMANMLHDSDAEEEIVEAFRVLDLDGEGKIPLSEIITLASGIDAVYSRDKVEELILREGIEVDAEGKVNYADFVRRMMAK